jgi:hypothetical protein
MSHTALKPQDRPGHDGDYRPAEQPAPVPNGAQEPDDVSPALARALRQEGRNGRAFVPDDIVYRGAIRQIRNYVDRAKMGDASMLVDLVELRDLLADHALAEVAQALNAGHGCRLTGKFQSHADDCDGDRDLCRAPTSAQMIADEFTVRGRPMGRNNVFERWIKPRRRGAGAR